VILRVSRSALALNEAVQRFTDRVLRLLPFLIRSSPLKVVAVETTTECTRRCVYCPPHHSLDIPPLRMDWSVYRRIVGSLAGRGFRGQLWYGLYGESLLDDRLEELVRHARTRLPAARLCLFSNGDKLTKERFISLRKSGLDAVFLSQHSPGSAPAAAQAWSVIAGVPDPGFISWTDYHSLFYEQGNRLNVLNNKGGLADVKRRPLSFCRDVRCTAVDCLGNVLLCNNDCTASYVFGNVLERDLCEIWDDPAFVAVRRQIIRGRWPFEICRRCAGGEGATTTPPQGPAARLPRAFHDFEQVMKSLGRP